MAGPTARLIVHPEDGEAWLLLAQARRGVGNWASAISACRKAIDTDNPDIQNRARYMCATIYQDHLDDHVNAILLLKKFIQVAEKGSAQEENARLRLAIGLIAIDNYMTAAVILDRLIETSSRATTVEKARRIRRQLPSTPEGTAGSQKD